MDSELSLPPARPSEVVRIDDALERCIRAVSLDDLHASGRREFRVISRQSVVREVLQLAETFVMERVRQMERDLGLLVERREKEAQEEGRLRVLHSIVDLGDMLDAMGSALVDDQAVRATQTLDKRLDRVFRNFGFSRIPTEGQRFDAVVHEMVDEVETDDVQDGVIVREIGRGYARDGFVLRVARVVVATTGTETV